MYRTLDPLAIDVHVKFDEGARLAVRYGFEGLALDADYLFEADTDATYETLLSHNLKPGTFGLPVDFRAADATYQASLARIEPVAKAAQRLGCSRASTYIFSWSDDKDYRTNFEFHRARLTRPAEILAEHGIALGLEFLGPETLRKGHPYTFIHTAETMLELCEAVGSNVGLLLDAWHWYTAGHDPATLAHLDKRSVVDVHVSDAPTGVPVNEQQDDVRCLPGSTGVIAMSTFFGALQRIQYDGPVSAEPFNAHLRTLPAEEAVRTTAESLQRVWPKVESEPL